MSDKKDLIKKYKDLLEKSVSLVTNTKRNENTVNTIRRYEVHASCCRTMISDLEGLDLSGHNEELLKDITSYVSSELSLQGLESKKVINILNNYLKKTNK